MNLPNETFRKFVELNKKKLSIALYENFPFSKELKSELDKILSLEKVKNYFNDESSLITYKYYYFLEFYRFLFKVLTQFDELNIGTKKDEKEKEKYFNDALSGNDFETKLKAEISYSKYVTKRFFEIYPHLRTQFNKDKKNSLVEWHSRDNFQRLMFLVDLREKDVKAKRNTSKDLELKMKILKRIIDKDFLGTKETNESIIQDAFDLECDENESLLKYSERLKKFSNKFYKWLDREDTKKLIESEKLKFLTSHLKPI